MLPANAYILGWMAAISSLLPAGRYRKTLPAIGNTRLNTLSRKASLPRWHWPPPITMKVADPIYSARVKGLMSLGYFMIRRDKQGYETWRKGRSYITLSMYGALYVGASTDRWMPAAERDDITEAGRHVMLKELSE